MHTTDGREGELTVDESVQELVHQVLHEMMVERIAAATD